MRGDDLEGGKPFETAGSWGRNGVMDERAQKALAHPGRDCFFLEALQFA